MKKEIVYPYPDSKETIINFKLKSSLMLARSYTKTELPNFRMLYSGNVIVFATSADGTTTEVVKIFKALGY